MTRNIVEQKFYKSCVSYKIELQSARKHFCYSLYVAEINKSILRNKKLGTSPHSRTIIPNSKVYMIGLFTKFSEYLSQKSFKL